MNKNISTSKTFNYDSSSYSNCFDYCQDRINLENFNYFSERLISEDNGNTTIEQFVNSNYASIVKYKPTKDESNKKLSINSLITNVLTAHKENKVVAISRTAYDYSIPKQYGLEHIKYNYTIKFLDQLVYLGFIKQVKGFYKRPISCGKLTRIWASQMLIDEINDHYSTVLFASNLVNIQGNRIVFSKSMDGIKKVDYKTPIILKKSKNKLIKYSPTKNTRQMDSFLGEYNLFIKSNSLIHPLSNPSTLTSNYLDLIKPKPLLDKKEDNLLLYKELEGYLYRVFNMAKFSLGGRYYGAEYQGLKEGERNNILINGNSTVELDFSNQHLQLLYNLCGLSLETDGYLILDEEYRPLVKLVSLITINAKNRTSAFRGFNKKLSKDKNFYKLYRKCGLSTLKLFEIFGLAHPKISEYFNSGIGLSLQNTDSKIATKVLEHFTKKGITCLTIHDSFIVEEHHKNELESVMNEAYKSVTGFNCKIK